MVRVYNTFCCVGLRRSVFVLGYLFATLETVSSVLHVIGGSLSILSINDETIESGWSLDLTPTQAVLFAVLYFIATGLLVLSFGSTLAMVYGLLQRNMNYLSQWAAVHGFLEIVVVIELVILLITIVCDINRQFNTAVVVICILLNMIGISVYYALRSHIMRENGKLENPWSMKEHEMENTPPTPSPLTGISRDERLNELNDRCRISSTGNSAIDKHSANRMHENNSSPNSVSSMNTRTVSINGLTRNTSLDGMVSPTTKCPPSSRYPHLHSPHREYYRTEGPVSIVPSSPAVR